MPANKRYVLLYDSATDPVPDKRNAGFAEALRNATLLERGSLCTVVDVSEYSPNELQEAFMEAVVVSVLKKYPGMSEGSGYAAHSLNNRGHVQ